MLLEVKSNQKGYQKAKKQLFDGKAQLEELLAAIGLKTTLWKYIGVFNAQIPDKLPLFNCKKCSVFAIIGDSIPENLRIIEDEVDKLQENWNPADHINEFVDIATHLLFVVQGDSRAPVTRANVIDKTVKHVERASKLEYMFHWTPDQLSLVQAALELSYVLIDAFYSTGKTEVLKYYGKTKKREKGDIHDNKVLLIIGLFVCLGILMEELVTMYDQNVIPSLFKILLEGMKHLAFCFVTFDPIIMFLYVEVRIPYSFRNLRVKHRWNHVDSKFSTEIF